MTRRRGLVPAVAACVLAGLAILVAGGKDWAWVDDGTRTYVSAEDAVGSLAPWAVVALTGAVAVLATRRWGRIPVGLALAAAGGVVAWKAFDLLRDTDEHLWRATRGTTLPIAWPVHETVWPWVALAAGLALVLTGTYVALRGPSWPALGARYDAPQRRDDPWAALDRGEDPTA